jgi:uncharacterized membrane protein (UPF0182 family)
VVSFEFPAGRNVNGPVQVFNAIQSYPPFSAQQTLLSQGGSAIVFGNFLVIPLGNSFLYVQPVFVQSRQQDSFPQLKRVVVVHGDSIGIGSTLNEAIADSYGATVTPPSGSGTSTGTGGGSSSTTGGGQQTIDDLVAEALSHFQKANAALKAGDLATYQSEIEKAQAIVQQIGAASIQQQSKGGSSSSGRTGGTQTSSTPTPQPALSPTGAAGS